MMAMFNFRFASQKILAVLTCLFFLTALCAQEKLIMDESVYEMWRTIKSPIISDNGDWTA